MVNRYMKRCSTSLIIRAMLIKTPGRDYLIPVRSAIIKKIEDYNIGEDVVKRNSYALLVGM